MSKKEIKNMLKKIITMQGSNHNEYNLDNPTLREYRLRSWGSVREFTFSNCHPHPDLSGGIPACSRQGGSYKIIFKNNSF